MIGAIIGDIAGSRFEFRNHRSKDFELFAKDCRFTDDTVMTLAIARALVDCKGDFGGLSEAAVSRMREIGGYYRRAGYGWMFYAWLFSAKPRPPYQSFGNGAAMRVSACGFAARSLEEAKTLSARVTAVTHDHPEGLKGAEATAVAIWLARSGCSREQIRARIEEEYYPLNFTIDELRPVYRFNETCQGTVPQAIEAFLESENFEDAIRTAVSLGGDSDTLAAITGGIAEAFYGVPAPLREGALSYLDERLRACVEDFERAYPA